MKSSNLNYANLGNVELAVTLKLFHSKMFDELFIAECKGKKGWNDVYEKSDSELLLALLNNLLTGQYVDVANYAMMLYKRKSEYPERILVGVISAVSSLSPSLKEEGFD